MTAFEAVQNFDPLIVSQAFQLKDKGLTWEEALAEVGADFKADLALAEALVELGEARAQIDALEAENRRLEARLEEGGVQQ